MLFTFYNISADIIYKNIVGTIAENVKLLEENIGEKLHDIGFGNDFMDMTWKAQSRKAKVNKSYYIELKSSCTTKETINRIKAICGMGENICKAYIW